MNPSNLIIRAELFEDAADVERVVQAAFADGVETSDFVRNVRASADVCLAQVVLYAGAMVAHAQYVRVPLTMGGRPVRAAYLSCLSVVPHLHRKGIGSLLVRHGLQCLREEGFAAALVLGSPKYYPRFGFSPALARKIQAPHNKRGDAFMAVELIADALSGSEGEAGFPNVLIPTAEHSRAERMSIVVCLETDPGRKRELQEHLTHLLPEWFGKAESNAHYAARAEVLDGYVAQVDGVPRGLLLLGKNSPKSAEIYWMGVDPTLHRKGIGKALVEAAAAGAKASGVKWFFVATLHPRDTYEPYRRTRSFYEAQGFEFVLEEQFPVDPENPVGWYLRPL